MRQQPEQFKSDNSNFAPDTLIPNVMAHLGLDASNKNAPTSLAETLEQLHADNWQTRLAAVEALSHQHTQLPIETLLPLLQDSDASVRAATVRILGRTNDAERLERLHIALNDTDWHVRETAVFVLGNSAYPPLELLATAQSDEDSTVRDAATMMLQEIQGDHIVIQPLVSLETRREPHNGRVLFISDTRQTQLIQVDSLTSKVYGYMNFLWSLPRTRGSRALLQEHKHVNESHRGVKKQVRKARQLMIPIVEGVLAALLIIGLVASWLLLSQRFHTTTTGTILLQQHLSGRIYPMWSPDGKQVILRGFGQQTYSDQTDNVYVWDIATNKLTKTLSFTDGDAQTFGDTMMSPDGSYISHAKDNLLRVWDTRTGRTAITYSDSLTLSNMEWSSDGRYIAINDIAGNVRVWNVEVGTEPITFATGLQSNSPAPTNVQWSPNNKYLFVAYGGGPIQVWNPFTGYKLQSIEDTTTGNASWLDNSRIIVSDLTTAQFKKANTSIHVWNAITGHELVTYTGHTMVPTVFDHSNDGKLILSGSSHEDLLWDSITGKTILHIPEGASLGTPSLSPDGKFIEANNGINTVQIWDATTGKRVANYHVINNLLSNVGTDTTTWLDTKNLFSVKQNGEVHIFDAMTGQVRYSFDLHTTSFPLWQWSPDYKKIVVALDNGEIEILQGID